MQVKEEKNELTSFHLSTGGWVLVLHVFTFSIVVKSPLCVLGL